MLDGNAEHGGLERLMVEMRPRLHRYCARMVGSAMDGEDVVQEALTRAVEAYPSAGTIDRPDSWLFRIAHNAALDALRRRKRQTALLSGLQFCGPAADSAGTDARIGATASLATLSVLPVPQRSSVVLIDVLGHSLAEAVDILGVSPAALKAALHRGRMRLKELAAMPDHPSPKLTNQERDRVQAYADRFNARDFDALRALLAEDVRLELVNRTRLSGSKAVSVYFTRYDEGVDWHLVAAMAENGPALWVRDPAGPAGEAGYVVILSWTDGRIAAIRDFRYAPYVMDSLVVRPL
jgi:RNA polymerase sigma-70 factor, ECF subfamily